MDFTREPIIETVITPRDGFRLAIRNSKNSAHEEHFVDALQVVSFGGHCFYRTTERPKAFILPVSDYEVIEVREPKILLKNPTIEGSVKISPSRSEKYQESRYESKHDSRSQESKQAETRHQEGKPHEVTRQNETRTDSRQEQKVERNDSPRGEVTRLEAQSQKGQQEETGLDSDSSRGSQAETGRGDRRRDRRRNIKNRRRGAEVEAGREEFDERTREGTAKETSSKDLEGALAPPKSTQEPILEQPEARQNSVANSQAGVVPSALPAILPPPSTLIRDDIARLKANELYRGAFYVRDESEQDDDDHDIGPVARARIEVESYEDFRARPEMAAPMAAPSSGIKSSDEHETPPLTDEEVSKANPSEDYSSTNASAPLKEEGRS